MLNASGHVLVPEFLPDEVRRKKGAPDSPAMSLNSQQGQGLNLPAVIDSLLRQEQTDVYVKVVEAVERVLLPIVLSHTHGHLTKSSELLGLNRATLRHKLRALGLSIDRTVTEEPHQDEPPSAT
jgi:two-component system nitrogen regulation response regulator GlnG